MMTELAPRHRTGGGTIYLVLLVGLALLLGLYLLLRYGGYWGEGDTVYFTRAIYSIQASEELMLPENTYQNGYAYQALIVWLAAFTDMPLGFLQIVAAALLLAWVVLPAWLAYRELTRSELAASLATLILLIQPEFLFSLLRGTHEKFTRGLMFLCLYLLVRSLRVHLLRLMALFIACFYLCAYAMISYNAFMASSFILAILVALGLVWLVGRRVANSRRVASPLVTRLFYVTFSLLVIAFIFIFYAYPPAQKLISTLLGVGDRLAMLALQVEDTASNPYQVVDAGWVSMPVYWLVSLANWLLLGLSLVLWLRQTYTWLVQRKARPIQHEIMLWALYAAFAFLGVISILVDVSGAIAANLQHRTFPSFVMLAAPLAGVWLARKKPQSSPKAKMTLAGISLAIGVLMVLSALKATSEPLLSNTWLFYTPAEAQAVRWAEDNLQQLSLWTGPSGRISDGYSIRENGRELSLELDPYVPAISTHDFLISIVTRLQAQRQGALLPVQADDLITYDNGTTQIHHRRPETPFQK